MIQFFMANLPWFWLALLIVFLVVEACTMSLTTIWCAISSVPLIFIARTPLAFRWQLLIFASLSFVLIVLTRPFAVKKLNIGKNKTNVNSLEGQQVLVTRNITQFEKGEAKAQNGVLWTAVSADGTDIEKGTVCIVSKVEGNSLNVLRKEQA